jgi:CcmD family protein
MIYLFGAFAILWTITFGYVFSLHTRQKQLARQLERLSKDSSTGSRGTVSR